MGKQKIKIVMETKTFAYLDKQGNMIIELPNYPNKVNVGIVERGVKQK